GMPVESQHASEGLEPPRIGQPPQHLTRAVFVHDGHRDPARQFPHARKQPRRRFAGVQRKLGELTFHVLTNVTASKASAGYPMKLTSTLPLSESTRPSAATAKFSSFANF